jgi:hypothetical protein
MLLRYNPTLRGREVLRIGERCSSMGVMALAGPAPITESKSKLRPQVEESARKGRFRVMRCVAL